MGIGKILELIQQIGFQPALPVSGEGISSQPMTHPQTANSPQSRDVGVNDPYALGAKVFQWLEKNKTFFTAMRSREALRELVTSFPAEAETYLPLVAGLLRALPGIAGQETVRMLHQVAAAHTQNVSPGRPEVLDIQTKRKIVNDVKELYGDGVQMLTAQERIAERYGQSLRSVQRTWRQRDKLPREPTSLAEIFEAISKVGS